MFIVVSAIAVIGGIGTVRSKSVVYASLFLLVSLMAVAGIYVLIFAPFLALVQILIYGGAIIVVVLFALMLTRRAGANEDLDNERTSLAFITSLAAMAIFIGIAVVNKRPKPTEPDPVPFRDLSSTLFSRWAIPFELASVLLLVALIGAAVMARPGDSK